MVHDLSAPDSLRGQLQRGLGRGYLCALEAEAAEIVLDCVLHDARWDRQIEDRIGYYASLALELNAPVERLAEALRSWTPESDGLEHAVDVLVEMSRRGGDRATRALRDALDSEASVLVLCAIFGCEDDASREAVGLSDADISAGLNALPTHALRWAGAERGLPWERWVHAEPRLADLVGSSRGSSSGALDGRNLLVDASLPTEDLLREAASDPRWRPRLVPVLAARDDLRSRELLRRAALGDQPELWMLACRVLGLQGVAGLIDSACDMLEADAGDTRLGRRRSAWIRYLDSLPAERTRPLARRWLGASGGAGIAAMTLMARNAELEDLPRVCALLERALDDGALYEACSLVEALETVGAPGSSTLLERAFIESPYACIRPRVLAALHAANDPLGPVLGREALWDSDVGARQTALAIVDIDSTTRARVQALRDDPWEEGEVREAARRRPES